MVLSTPFLTAVLYTGQAYVCGACLWFTAGLKCMAGSKSYIFPGLLSTTRKSSWSNLNLKVLCNAHRLVYMYCMYCMNVKWLLISNAEMNSPSSFQIQSEHNHPVFGRLYDLVRRSQQYLELEGQPIDRLHVFTGVGLQRCCHKSLSHRVQEAVVIS